MPYSEGIATHIDPESCIIIRKAKIKALAGVRVRRAVLRDPGALRMAEGYTGCIDKDPAIALEVNDLIKTEFSALESGGNGIWLKSSLVLCGEGKV